MNRSSFIAALIVVVTALVVIPGTVSAQLSLGQVDVYADPTGTSCSINDQTPGTFAVYVLHRNYSAAAGVEVRLAESAGFHATYLGETVNAPGTHTGDFHTGIRVNYGFCDLGGSRLVGTIIYQGNGTSEPCSYLKMVGDYLHTGAPGVIDCQLQFGIPAFTFGPLYVNPQPGLCQSQCNTIPTSPATWGKVKALYRN